MLHDKVFAGTTVPSIAPSNIPSNDPTSFQPKKPSQNPSKQESEHPTAIATLFVLHELYSSTGGINWIDTWDFSSGESWCSFHGITCDDFDQIIKISLEQNNLEGTIPSELGMLASLRSLRLHYNYIAGTIPSELGALSS